jgi:glycerophosphoryl diester phosphodiesterase
MPENTIPGMIKAIEDGANALEMDLQFTADGKVVVTHDPFINRSYNLDSQGNEIPKKDARKHIIYQMDYSEVRSFDVGSKVYPKYPEQKKFKTHIPELGELISNVEAFVIEHKFEPVIYNIEIKAGPDGDDLWHPAPADLVAMIVKLLKASNIENRYYLQSFDVRQIQEVKRSYPEIPVALLTADHGKTIEQHIKPVGFTPEIFSPYYKIVTKSMIAESQNAGMRIMPWTVNDVKTMKSLLKKGVDGIITDYPNVLCQLRKE